MRQFGGMPSKVPIGIRRRDALRLFQDFFLKLIHMNISNIAIRGGGCEATIAIAPSGKWSTAGA